MCVRLHGLIRTCVLDSRETNIYCGPLAKEAKSATMYIFWEKKILFKSFVKVELSYVFTINLFTIAGNCTEK